MNSGGCRAPGGWKEIRIKGAGGPEGFGGHEGTDDGATMAVVAPHFGVGGDRTDQVVVVFPGEVESGGKGLVDVAGGAEALANHDAVGLAGPGFGLAG